MSSGDVVRRPRARQALADMVRSLGLMAVVIAALLLLGPARTLVFPGDNRVQAVDYAQVVTGFARVSGTSALQPSGLPASWRANAARVVTTRATGHQLHIGWALPHDHFVGLDEATGRRTAVLDRLLGSTAAAGSTTRVGGRVWDVLRSARGETALVRSARHLTVVVTGDAADTDLRRLAGSLR